MPPWVNGVRSCIYHCQTTFEELVIGLELDTEVALGGAKATTLYAASSTALGAGKAGNPAVMDDILKAVRALEKIWIKVYGRAGWVQRSDAGQRLYFFSLLFRSKNKLHWNCLFHSNDHYKICVLCCISWLPTHQVLNKLKQKIRVPAISS